MSYNITKEKGCNPLSKEHTIIINYYMNCIVFLMDFSFLADSRAANSVLDIFKFVIRNL